MLCTGPDPPSFAMLDMNATWAKVAWEPSRSGVPGSVFYVQYRTRGQSVIQPLTSSKSHVTYRMTPISMTLSVPLAVLKPFLTPIHQRNMTLLTLLCVYMNGKYLWSLIATVFQKCLQCFDAVGWAAGRASGL